MPLLAFATGFVTFYTLAQFIVTGTFDPAPLISFAVWATIGFIATFTFMALGLDEKIKHLVDNHRAMRRGRRGPIGLREAAQLGKAKRAARK